MVIVTDTCGRHGHPEFVLEADDAQVPPVYLENIAGTIRNMVASGSVFRPGEHFQIGGVLTRVERAEGDRLTLAEPDMQSMPIRFVPGISQTLRQLMLQLFMLDSVSLRHEINIPALNQSLITCTRDADPGFFMTRSAPSHDADTGWFVGCLDDDHDHDTPANLKCVSVYEAFLRRHAIGGFLAFPVDSTIAVDPRAGVHILKGDQALPIEPGSFLDLWMKRQAIDPSI